MKLLSKLGKYKRIFAPVLIILLTVCFEAAFNFQAILNGYESIDLSSYIQVVKEGDNEKYVVDYGQADGIYISKVHIAAEFPENNAYAIQISEINGFGKENEVYYEDTVHSWFRNFSTSLNKKISSLRITIPKPEGAEVFSVSISNRLEFNKYRMLFVFLILIFMYLVFFERKALEKIEYYFAFFSVAIGMLLIVCGQPICNSWDEAFHFEKSYSLANGKNVEWSQAAAAVSYKSVPACNTKEEFAELRKAINEKGKGALFTESDETIGITYSTLAYLPMAVLIKLGLLLSLPFTKVFMLGKLGNLLFYTFIMFWAIRLAKQKKLFLACIAMMPTSVFLASSYTYDSCVFACVTLGCVLWCNEALYAENNYNIFNVTLAILLLSVGCLSKAVYIPLVLLMLLLPQFLSLGKKKWIIYGIGILVICGLVMLTFVLPVLTNTVAGNLSYGGDARGGDTGTIRQLISMVQHPVTSVKLMISNILQLDNFRNLGTPEADNFFFGNLMFLNLAQFGVMPDKWAALLVPTFITVLFLEDRREKRVVGYTLWKRIVMLAILLCTVFLVWLALYLDFTPVGEETILGVQARYYLPLLYLGALLCINQRFSFRINYKAATRLMLISVNVFWIVSIYELVLQYRLI